MWTALTAEDCAEPLSYTVYVTLELNDSQFVGYSMNPAPIEVEPLHAVSSMSDQAAV